MENTKKIVLVVEDEKPLAKALELKLTKAGFEVTTCQNGGEALNKIAQTNFDVILCDLVMPEMDGFAFLTKLRENAIRVPVIVLTNLSQTEDENKAKDLGAQDFFVKADTPLWEIVEKVQKLANEK